MSLIFASQKNCLTKQRARSSQDELGRAAIRLLLLEVSWCTDSTVAAKHVMDNLARAQICETPPPHSPLPTAKKHLSDVTLQDLLFVHVPPLSVKHRASLTKPGTSRTSALVPRQCFCCPNLHEGLALWCVLLQYLLFKCTPGVFPDLRYKAATVGGVYTV